MVAGAKRRYILNNFGGGGAQNFSLQIEVNWVRFGLRQKVNQKTKKKKSIL